jgi:hypothetical protein
MNAHRILTAAFLTATALTVGSSPVSAMQADDFGPTTTERERGIVLECQGEAGGLEAYASLYENNRYGNVLQVVLGGPDSGNGRSKTPKRPFLEDGTVRGTITIDGAKARIRGTAEKIGKKKKVHEVHDDAGYLITVDGTHKRLATDLVLRYDGVQVPLTCDPAFRYDLMVTKQPIA